MGKIERLVLHFGEGRVRERILEIRGRKSFVPPGFRLSVYKISLQRFAYTVRLRERAVGQIQGGKDP